MKDYELKYGCNPNQKPAKIFMEDGSNLPIEILNGPSRIHKSSGCHEQLAAGKRDTRRAWDVRGCFV